MQKIHYIYRVFTGFYPGEVNEQHTDMEINLMRE